MPRRDPRPVWHLYPNGHVERGNGRPGYTWCPAYSQSSGNGMVTMPLTRREWWAMAHRDGARCQFHPTRRAADLAAWPIPTRA